MAARAFLECCRALERPERRRRCLEREELVGEQFNMKRDGTLQSSIIDSVKGFFAGRWGEWGL